MWVFGIAFWCFLPTARALCYSPGPAFPALILTQDSPGLERLVHRLDETINDVLQRGGDAAGSWDASSTSFALQVTSATDSLWSWYHSAAKQGSNPPHVVTGDTFFRIASISKTFTVYALLLEHLSLDDPVTKWLPDLVVQRTTRDDLAIDWDAISLRALVSHQAGIHRDSGGPCFLWREVLELHPEWRDELLSHGFPPIQPTDGDTAAHCTYADILRTAQQAARVFPPNTEATYSNVAFSLLGAVLESAAGKSYEEVINSSILQPLQMQRTTTQKPEDSQGVIPVGHNDWYKPFGDDVATAGLYSTPNDLTIYLRSLLYPATLLPQVRLDAWMKPATWTNSGSATAYGLAWEIYRTSSLTPDHRPVDLISKGGMLNGYRSTVILIPEFQLAAVLLAAGTPEAHDDLRQSITSALIPIADELLHEEASRRYSGCYALAEGNINASSPFHTSSIELAADSQGPGLLVKSWISHGANFLTIYARLQGTPLDSDRWQVRLLPSDPVMLPSTVEVWRAALVPKRDAGRVQGSWDEYCATDIDDLAYAGKSVGEFRIGVNDKGEAVEVNAVGLRTTLRRSSCDLTMPVQDNSDEQKASRKSEL